MEEIIIRFAQCEYDFSNSDEGCQFCELGGHCITLHPELESLLFTEKGPNKLDKTDFEVLNRKYPTAIISKKEWEKHVTGIGRDNC